MFQHAFEKFKSLGCFFFKLIVNGVTQVSDCFNVKLNMLFYMHSILVSMFIMFPIIKLRNYMVSGQNKPQTVIIINIKNGLHVYHVFSLTVTVSNKTLSVYRGHVRQIYIGSIIG